MEYHCQNFTQFTYSNIVTNYLGMTFYQSCSNCIIHQEMAIKSDASFFLSIKRKPFLAGLLFYLSKGSKVFAIRSNFPAVVNLSTIYHQLWHSEPAETFFARLLLSLFW